MNVTTDFVPILLNVNQVAELLGCHRNTIWNHVRNDKMPKPARFEGKTVWHRGDIEDFAKTFRT